MNLKLESKMTGDTLMTSLPAADCSKFLLQRRGTLGRRSEVDGERRRCQQSSLATGCIERQPL